MARVPIVRLGDTLFVAVQEEMQDRDALLLQEDLNLALERTGARGVLLDISVVETVDSYLGRVLSDVAEGARLLGARTVVVGMQPAVAITLVELGLELRGVSTALDVERGRRLLAKLLRDDDRAGGRAADRNGRRHGR